MKLKTSEKGLALITTLLITAILVTIVAEFIFKTYVSTARAANYKDSARAALVAEDGVIIAKAGLEELLKRRPNLNIEEDGLKMSRPVGDDLTVDIRIVDEKGKASLFIVYPKTGLSNERAEGSYIRLLKNLSLDEHLKDTLADWIDSDNDVRHYGAEANDYYRQLRAPYSPRNNYPDSVDELLMVKDYTKEGFEKISPFVTVYNQDGLININTAPKEVLMSLSDDMTPELAEKIISFRKGSPLKDRSEIMKVPGFETIGFSLQDKITVSSNIFRIYSRARAGDAVREAEAVVRTGGGIIYWREM
ncbi:MAG: type II secretion system minor pseudopilin GspK [Deltaproteobacteria bacterium]|nr:type II secretion system minor pseudopilin GspK [Deltaproteobacteria bacterium]